MPERRLASPYGATWLLGLTCLVVGASIAGPMTWPMKLFVGLCLLVYRLTRPIDLNPDYEETPC